jgi:hypothetical protein
VRAADEIRGFLFYLVSRKEYRKRPENSQICHNAGRVSLPFPAIAFASAFLLAFSLPRVIGLSSDMKKHVFVALAFILLIARAAEAQSTDRAGIDKVLMRIFGDNNSFTADMLTTQTVHDESTSIPGKIACHAGNIRTETDLGNARSPRMRPENTAHLRAMGLGKTVEICRPNKKLTYLLYPDLAAYAETPLQNADLKPDSAFKVKTTELGKETIDGHPCVKNKVVVTDDGGNNYETTVWNATDLKNFPLKI